MLTPLVAGVFALAGVLLGAFLEPVKARVAARTRLREERALRSAQLVEAATIARDAVLWLFRTVRTVAPPLPADAELIAEAEQRYWSARSDIKKALLLLRLVGPDELIAGAVAVAEADRDLRKLWFDRDPAARQSHSNEMFAALERGRLALDEFTDLARRLTTPR
ncbi:MULTISPECIES: hypothetical protein [unclassified Amycolatopsis]|uniref:hypothetical protein n=1 Tax=unclassified Amycolatopsis TaxID=2618356 RepID=UPI00287520DB|nr:MULTISPECIES: hypothetical protein [unclassified Amycolatopsis]MDS0139842.1 hypothetical protein [Amycolatopsis sp. 505]MDS0148246.1 hypothetical protein [Amycolatopsis sp. CM201R]